jgi:hypothetical protein
VCLRPLIFVEIFTLLCCRQPPSATVIGSLDEGHRQRSNVSHPIPAHMP